jgi:hypothetical protein
MIFCAVFFFAVFILFALVFTEKERPIQIFGLLFFGSFATFSALYLRSRVIVDETGVRRRGMISSRHHRWFEIRSYRRYEMHSR